MTPDQIVSLSGIKTTPRNLNLDPLLANAFKLVFAKAPNMSLFMQNFDLPGLSISYASQPSRYLNLKQIGEKISYSPFQVTFLVNASLENYKEIVNWMKRITVNNNNNQRDEFDTATLIVNDNTTVIFHNVWPSQVGNLEFLTNASDAPHMSCTATFEYDYWEFA